MLNINNKLYNDITAYCKLNNIENVDKFCSDLLEKAFVVEKYGSTPQIVPTKIVEKIITIESENNVSLQNETIKVDQEPEKVTPDAPKKIFKKANLNDDYKIYDNL